MGDGGARLRYSFMEPEGDRDLLRVLGFLGKRTGGLESEEDLEE